MWCRAPAASILDFLGMRNHYHHDKWSSNLKP
jgi:hypothetical protein